MIFKIILISRVISNILLKKGIKFKYILLWQAMRFFAMDWPFGRNHWTCRWFPLVWFINIALSFLIMTLISVNRALAIVDDNLAKKVFTWTGTTIMVVCLWLFSMSFILPSVLGYWGSTGYLEPIFRGASISYLDDFFTFLPLFNLKVLNYGP